MKINIGRFFKAIKGRDPPGDKEFLNQLREKLVDYIKVNPLSAEKAEEPALSRFQFKTVPSAIFFCFIVLASGTFVYSQDSLPGNALYPVKILSEKIRSAAAINPRTAADLHIDLAQKRVVEIERLLDNDVSESGGDERLKNINAALTNFTLHIDSNYKRAQDLKEIGDFEEALAANTDLEITLSSSKNRLEANKEKVIEGKEKEIYENTLNSVSDWEDEIKEDKKDIAENEKILARSLGFERSAMGKMEAAENKIDEVRDFINKKREGKSDVDEKSAESKLDEAKKLLNDAKSLYNEQKFEEAFGKSAEAFETASLAKTLVKIFPESPKIAERAGGGDRAMIASSSSSTNLRETEANNDEDKKEKEKTKEGSREDEGSGDRISSGGREEKEHKNDESNKGGNSHGGDDKDSKKAIDSESDKD